MVIASTSADGVIGWGKQGDLVQHSISFVASSSKYMFWSENDMVLGRGEVPEVGDSSGVFLRGFSIMRGNEGCC